MKSKGVVLSPEKMSFLKELWGHDTEAHIDSLGLISIYVISYIDANFHKVITRKKIAAHFNISPDYLSRVFQKECEICLMVYITRFRMYNGKKILVSFPHMKVKDISLDVGISDAAYFCRLFKKHTQMSPQAFRLKSFAHDDIKSNLLADSSR